MRASTPSMTAADIHRPDGGVALDAGDRAVASAAPEWLAMIYDEYALGRTEPLFEHLADDVLWVVKGRVPVLQSVAGSYRAPAGVLQFFERLARDWTVIRYTVEEMTAQGERVQVRSRVLAVNLNTGKHVEAVTNHRLVLRGRAIVQFEESYEDEELLAAAGHLDACSPVSRPRRD